MAENGLGQTHTPFDDEAATVSTQRTIPIGEIERAASLPGVTVMNLGSATKVAAGCAG
jgi:hypothetical protein